jgi:cytochrome P450 family 103
MDAQISVEKARGAPVGVQPPTMTLAELEADTHGTFRRYRKTHSVVLHEAGGYFVLRFADVDRLSKDPRLSGTETAFPKKLGLEQGAIFDAFDHSMLTANGDTHRRRRAPFSKLFAVRAIAEMRPHIRRTIEEVIDGFYDDGEIEFVDTFASPIPARVIADLFGLPREDIPDFARDSYEATQILSFGLSPERIAEIDRAGERLRDYIIKILDERRRKPRGDFLSAYLAAATQAGEMSPEEVLYQIFLLVAAATDTTRISIAAQTSLLLQNRQQWMEVCRDPALIPAAVAESLRLEPSGSAVTRITREDIEVDGTVIPAGNLVSLSTLSAMRDERVYDHPDAFNIHRTDMPRLHPVFGYGVHRCLGEALARAELEESLAAITTRIPQLQMSVPPAFIGHYGVRRVSEMRVSWKP